jgi:hypothetical protein
MIRLLLIALLSLPLAGIPFRALGQTPDPDDIPRSQRTPIPAPVVAKGPCKPIEGPIVPGMKLYLKGDKRLIGSVTTYRPKQLFADGKTREGVKIQLISGKATWLPADTVRHLYLTQ